MVRTFGGYTKSYIYCSTTVRQFLFSYLYAIESRTQCSKSWHLYQLLLGNTHHVVAWMIMGEESYKAKEVAFGQFKRPLKSCIALRLVSVDNILTVKYE